MKKIISLLLVNLVFLFLLAKPVLAIQQSQLSGVNSEGATIPISYDLPYPGILPDSPLYPVKELRDTVVGWLILSNVNKSFYNLLMADKRLAAGQVLVNTGKTVLGTGSVIRAEEYFSKAVDSAQRAKENKLEVTELLIKLSVSAVKHQEVVGDLMVKVPEQEKAALSKTYSDSQNSQNRVQDLMRK